MNLFQLGDFTLHSGAKSAWKIDCDALTDGDCACLAKMIRQLVGPFSSVEGVPRGGLKLAWELTKLIQSQQGPHLIVDDVLTTGRSLVEAGLRYAAGKGWASPEETDLMGAVVFARGPCPPWVKALFQLPRELWLPSSTPGVPSAASE